MVGNQETIVKPLAIKKSVQYIQPMDKITPNKGYQQMLAEAPKRRAEALKLHAAGSSLAAIGEALGVSRERARQLVKKAQQEAAAK
jgi:DNA-directed RNA polymerase specialized sigma24 family protein